MEELQYPSFAARLPPRLWIRVRGRNGIDHRRHLKHSPEWTIPVKSASPGILIAHKAVAAR